MDKIKLCALANPIDGEAEFMCLVSTSSQL